MMNTPKEQIALAKIEQSTLLSDTLRLEPERMQMVITEALSYDGKGNRWHVYESLKGIVRSMVGWEAIYEELATSGHYEVMIRFVDWLITLAVSKVRVDMSNIPTLIEDDEEVA